MSKRADMDLIEDILVCLSKVDSYIFNFDYEQFKKDFKTQDAVIRNIEIIGEAVKKLSKEIKEANPDIPWKTIAGVRDRLIHGYFGVNIDIIWEIASVDLPDLEKKLQNVKKKLGN